MGGLRRSRRHTTACYDSNGRDYLAHTLGLTQPDFETWVASATVHPHLQLWYNLCIIGRRRFEDGREWIETGADGYFYHSDHLQDDLLLLCMDAGNVEDLEEVAGSFADQEASTFSWTTQEVWARTAWRVVQGNRGSGQMFEKQMSTHAAAAYGASVDLLTIAFHSIVFRGGNSVWHDLIRNRSDSPTPSTPATPSIPPHPSTDPFGTVMFKKETGLDRDPKDSEWDDRSGDSAENDSTDDVVSEMSDSDDDFAAPHTPSKQVKKRACTPEAPKKAGGRSCRRYSLRSWMESRAGEEDGDDIVVAPRKRANLELCLVDENGSPITGYRMAAQR